MHSLEEDRVDLGDSGGNLCCKSIQHVTWGDAPCGSSAASVYAVMEKRFQTPKEDLHYRYQLQSKPSLQILQYVSPVADAIEMNLQRYHRRTSFFVWLELSMGQFAVPNMLVLKITHGQI